MTQLCRYSLVQVCQLYSPHCPPIPELVRAEQSGLLHSQCRLDSQAYKGSVKPYGEEGLKRMDIQQSQEMGLQFAESFTYSAKSRPQNSPMK